MLDWISPDTGPVVDGDLVRLRAPRMSDFSEWARVRSGSRAFLQPWEPVWPVDDLTRAAFRRRLSLYTRDRDLGLGHAFFVVRKSDDALVGGINLRNITRGVAQSAAIGYWAGQPYARSGYTLAALKTLTRFAFINPGSAPAGGRLLHRQRAVVPTSAESGLQIRGRGPLLFEN